MKNVMKKALATAVVVVAAALLLTTMTGVPFAGPRHAIADEPPNSLGLPGLSLTNVLPTRRSAPLSVGVQYGYGNYDPEGGIAADFNRPDLRSQDIRLQIQLRAGSGIRMAAGVPLRILSYEGGETVTGFGDIQGSLAIRVLQTGRNGLGLWGSLTVPSGNR